MADFPRFNRVHQEFPRLPALDCRRAVAVEFEKLRPLLRSGMRVAVGVGSRGISHLDEIVGLVIEALKRAGAKPFIVPAMGSHGGATLEGQRDILAGYGVSEQALGVPVLASLDVREVGRTADGKPVYCSSQALDADGIVVINRIKPHTDFSGTLGSGLLKMCVIGLGKRTGAAAMHLAASELGHEHAIRTMAGVLLSTAPILGGVAILENQFHDTARIVVLPRDDMEQGEGELLEEARRLMPLLPFEDIDLLIIDRLGKNISGSGMDTNVINRSVNGYSTSLQRAGQSVPFIRRIFVRDLTPETHGNAIGIGLADFTTTRLVRATDVRVTGINSLTSLTMQGAKLPIAFDTDREAIERALASLPLARPNDARIVRIADTLSVASMEISEPLWEQVKSRTDIRAEGALRELEFGGDGNLAG